MANVVDPRDLLARLRAIRVRMRMKLPYLEWLKGMILHESLNTLYVAFQAYEMVYESLALFPPDLRKIIEITAPYFDRPSFSNELPAEYRNDKEIALFLVSRNPGFYPKLLMPTQAHPEVVKLAMEKRPSNATFLPKTLEMPLSFWVEFLHGSVQGSDRLIYNNAYVQYLPHRIWVKREVLNAVFSEGGTLSGHYLNYIRQAGLLGQVFELHPKAVKHFPEYHADRRLVIAGLRDGWVLPGPIPGFTGDPDVALAANWHSRHCGAMISNLVLSDKEWEEFYAALVAQNQDMYYRVPPEWRVPSVWIMAARMNYKAAVLHPEVLDLRGVMRQPGAVEFLRNKEMVMLHLPGDYLSGATRRYEAYLCLFMAAARMQDKEEPFRYWGEDDEGDTKVFLAVVQSAGKRIALASGFAKYRHLIYKSADVPSFPVYMQCKALGM
jgi:hypothetical protein